MTFHQWTLGTGDLYIQTVVSYFLQLMSYFRLTYRLRLGREIRFCRIQCGVSSHLEISSSN